MRVPTPKIKQSTLRSHLMRTLDLCINPVYGDDDDDDDDDDYD